MWEAIKRPLFRTLLVLLLAIIIKICTWNANGVEQFYSARLYPVIAMVLRALTGWLPFSLGDLLYTAAFIYLLAALVRRIRKLVKHGFSRQLVLPSLLRIMRRLLWIYIIFMLCWGINYSRRGFAWQLQITAAPYTTEDLADLSTALLQRVNTARRSLGDSVSYPSFDSLKAQSVRAYRQIGVKYPFLQYKCPSIKASMYSGLLTYAGYTGYYNPFSGEAQVNVKVPPFYLPYVLCHEMAHQVGYGDESEANFVSYLVSVSSDQPLFHYSAYYDLFNYANGELYMRDSAAARKNYRALDTLVKADRRAARLFFLQYQNRIEPIIKFMYGEYLKANNQPQGIDTYEAVTAWLIAYRKKYGQI
jgi:lysophospholipase L1-like esterase